MAPSRRKTATRKNPARVIITRSIYKKQQEANKLKLSKEEPRDSSANNTCEEEENDVVCSTPRGKKYTIPKISTCPPAPKKKRVVLNPSRAVAAAAAATGKFFSHPDLDVFFVFSSPKNQSRSFNLDSN